jgi:LuxR family maltose regulon positive regulatory protein
MHWVQTLGLHADDELSYRREADHLTLAQVLIAQREPEPALRLLTRLCETAESSGRTGTVIKVLVIEALAFQAAGDRVKALEALGRALSLAEPEGYVRTFVDAGASMAVLLSRFLRGQQRKPLSSTLAPSPAYVRTLLKAFEPATSSSTGKFNGQEIAQSEANPLSERELEVLRLIASGQSVTQIARGLVVSANTVKSHLRSIYAKLDVHKNVEAVTKASITGLLESA